MRRLLKTDNSERVNKKENVRANHVCNDGKWELLRSNNFRTS